METVRSVLITILTINTRLTFWKEYNILCWKFYNTTQLYVLTKPYKVLSFSLNGKTNQKATHTALAVHSVLCNLKADTKYIRKQKFHTLQSKNLHKNVFSLNWAEKYEYSPSVGKVHNILLKDWKRARMSIETSIKEYFNRMYVTVRPDIC